MAAGISPLAIAFVCAFAFAARVHTGGASGATGGEPVCGLPDNTVAVLSELGIPTTGLAAEAVLDSLLQQVIEVGGTTRRAADMIMRRTAAPGGDVKKQIDTWAKVLQKRRKIMKTAEIADAGAEFFEFKDDRFIDDDGKEVIMSVSGQEMRDKQDLKMGKSPLRDRIIEHLGNATRTVEWRDLSKAVSTYATGLAAKAADLDADCVENAADGDQPLHRALKSEQDDNTLRLLVSACPQACRIKDNTGSLAYHLAQKVGASESVIAAILRAYPAAGDGGASSGQPPGWWGITPGWWEHPMRSDEPEDYSQYAIHIETIRGIEWIPISFSKPFTRNLTTVTLLTRAIDLAQDGNGAAEFVELMLRHGANPNLIDPTANASSKSAPFLEACRANQLPANYIILTS